MDNLHYISSEVLSLETLQEIISQDKKLALSDESIENIENEKSDEWKPSIRLNLFFKFW